MPPIAMIRAEFFNDGKIAVRSLVLDDPQPPVPVEGQLTSRHSLALFKAGAEYGYSVSLMYTFELWQDVYPLQILEAVGGDDPFVLDPVPTVPHEPGVRLDIRPSTEVSFSAKKVRGKNKVVITATRPGMKSQIVVDTKRPCFSITLFLPPDQRGYVHFKKWPGLKTGKKFVYPPR